MSLKNACMLPVGLLLLAASPALARKWTDNIGKYSVEAELVEVKGDDVLLKKPDGSIIPVPITRLSDADRRYLEDLNKQMGETRGRLKTPQEQPPRVAKPRPVAKEPKGATVPTGGPDAAVAEIEKVQGHYRCDEKSPNRPIVDVRLNGLQVTDSVLEHFKGLTGLQRLWLFDTKVTDAGLEHLKGLTGLQVLVLNKTEITDAGLEHLKGLTSLQSLVLTETRVTDAGLEHLKGLTSLKLLSLGGTLVTDAGVNNLLRANKALWYVADPAELGAVAAPTPVAEEPKPTTARV